MTTATSLTTEITAPTPTTETSTVSPIPFLGTHNATVTLLSPTSGEHRTFKISTVKGGHLTGRRIISLLIGTNNESDYQGFGFVYDDGTVHVWKKYAGTVYERYGDLFDRPVYWANRGVQYMSEGRCRRCNRKLTHPDSISSGLGSECIKKV